VTRVFRALAAAAAVALVPAPARAASEWYEYYLEGLDLVRQGRCPDALPKLQEAVRLKPNSALQARTYGMEFINYFPYYYLGACYLKAGDVDGAILRFNIEESKEAIKKSEDIHRELLKLRAQAEAQRDANQRQEVARKARAEADRYLREGLELEKARKYEEALTKLANAEGLARGLDPGIQRQVTEARERIRATEKETADTTSRAQRLEAALAEGSRLLESGKHTEAMMQFESALGIDPRNVRAQEGKRSAQEGILASTTRENRQAAFDAGKKLFDAGQYEQSLAPLTDAAADPRGKEARDLLAKATKIVQGMRQQKDIRTEIDKLLAKGEALFADSKFPEAQVAFESVLRLDPGNVRAKARQAVAEARVGEALFAKWLPNKSPILTFFEPRAAETEVEGPTAPLWGVATDDRGIDRVEFKVGGKVAAEQRPLPRLDGGESQRTLPINREFPLEKGPNEIAVSVYDNGGMVSTETFRITRKLRFYEAAYFFPAALGGAVGLIGLGFGAVQARRRRAVRQRFNPYIAGAPVLDEEMFFGRQRLLNRMLNVLHHNSLMITGERRIGKTTFLYRLRKVLAEDEGTEYQFFPVFTDLQGVPETGFFHALMTDVVETLALSPETQGALRFRSDAERYDGRDFSHDLQRVIAELKTRTAKKVKLAFLIDEVDVLNEYSEAVNQRLRSIFMKTFSENLVAVMSGVGIKRVWKSEVSPWYNFFDEVELTAFTREEAEALIKTPVAGVFRYEAEAVEGILTLSELKPYVIQKFCIHAVNRMLELGRTMVTRADVDAVREAVQIEERIAVREPAPAVPQVSA
jgi:tetratricopeptide (TPR) repeat protein